MDIVRNNGGKKLVKKIVIASVLLCSMTAAVILANLDFDTRRIDKENMLFGDVQFGKLQVLVGGNGVLKPKYVEYVTSREEGTVSIVSVKRGDLVKKGDLLAVLLNTSIETESEKAASEYESAKLEKMSLQIDNENALLNQQSTVLESKFALEKSELDFEANENLYQQNLVSKIEFKKVSLQLSQQKEMYEIQMQRLHRYEDNMKNQQAIQEARVMQALNSLEKLDVRLKSLSIYAESDGVIQDIELNVGQLVKNGDQIARIVNVDELYAEIKVPTTQAKDVEVGQRVIVDARTDVIEGVVDRVDTSVIDGSVYIDVKLTEKLPKAARPDMSVDAQIYLAEIENTLYVDKPASFRSNGKQTIYKVDVNGKYAMRTVIEVGLNTVNYIEIKSGLEAGDKVILSDSSEWQNQDRILLN